MTAPRRPTGALPHPARSRRTVPAGIGVRQCRLDAHQQLQSNIVGGMAAQARVPHGWISFVVRAVRMSSCGIDEGAAQRGGMGVRGRDAAAASRLGPCADCGGIGPAGAESRRGPRPSCSGSQRLSGYPFPLSVGVSTAVVDACDPGGQPRRVWQDASGVRSKQLPIPLCADVSDALIECDRDECIDAAPLR